MKTCQACSCIETCECGYCECSPKQIHRINKWIITILLYINNICSTHYLKFWTCNTYLRGKGQKKYTKIYAPYRGQLTAKSKYICSKLLKGLPFKCIPYYSSPLFHSQMVLPVSWHKIVLLSQSSLAISI